MQVVIGVQVRHHLHKVWKFAENYQVRSSHFKGDNKKDLDDTYIHSSAT